MSAAPPLTKERLALAGKIIASFVVVARNECPRDLFVGPSAEEDRKTALLEAFLLAVATMGRIFGWSDERLTGEFKVALREVTELRDLAVRMSPGGSS